MEAQHMYAAKGHRRPRPPGYMRRRLVSDLTASTTALYFPKPGPGEPEESNGAKPSPAAAGRGLHWRFGIRITATTTGC